MRASAEDAEDVWALSVLGAKAASPRSVYSRRQRANTLCARSCSRQTWAGRFSPVASWRTISRVSRDTC